ncbi:hypothetical protein [Aquimarina agarilytica]|nr:hypothetical protein [Aquimarina agarilytica]
MKLSQNQLETTEKLSQNNQFKTAEKLSQNQLKTILGGPYLDIHPK